MDTFYLVVVQHQEQKLVFGPYVSLGEATVFMVDFCGVYLKAQYKIDLTECNIQLNECFMDETGSWQTILDRTLLEELNDSRE